MNFSLLISIGSFLLSLLTYLYVKGTVEVFTIWQRHVTKSILIDTDDGPKPELKAPDGTQISVYRVEISNTSNQDVGLSGFRVVNANNDQMQIITLDNLYGTYGYEGSSIRFIDENGAGMLAHLPQNLSNTSHAKQTTVYDIVIFEPIGEPQPFTTFLVFSTIKTNMVPFGSKIIKKNRKYDLVLQTGIKRSVILTVKVIIIKLIKRLSHFLRFSNFILVWLLFTYNQ